MVLFHGIFLSCKLQQRVHCLTHLGSLAMHFMRASQYWIKCLTGQPDGGYDRPLFIMMSYHSCKTLTLSSVERKFYLTLQLRLVRFSKAEHCYHTIRCSDRNMQQTSRSETPCRFHIYHPRYGSTKTERVRERNVHRTECSAGKSKSAGKHLQVAFHNSERYKWARKKNRVMC